MDIFKTALKPNPWNILFPVSLLLLGLGFTFLYRHGPPGHWITYFFRHELLGNPHFMGAVFGSYLAGSLIQGMIHLIQRTPHLARRIGFAAGMLLAIIFIAQPLIRYFRIPQQTKNTLVANNPVPAPRRTPTATFNHPPYLLGGMAEVVASIESLNVLIGRDPTDNNLRMRRGLAYQKLTTMQGASSRIDDYRFVEEWTNQAHEDFTAVITADPMNDGAYYGRATLHGQGKTVEAIADLTRAIILQPKESQYYFMRGNHYIQTGELGLAIQDFTQALTLDQTDRRADIFFARGDAHETLGEYAAALADYDAGLEIMPNYTQAHERRAAIAERIKSE